MAKKTEIGKILPPVLELDQFFRVGGETLCFRPECGGCRWESGCVREEVSRKVGPGINPRRAFTGPPGFKVVAIDYSGIELRIIAEMANVRPWIDMWKKDSRADLHAAMCCLMFKLPEYNPDLHKEKRKIAKIANFNLAYGGAPYIFEKHGCTPEEARENHRSWWEAIPDYEFFFNQTFNEARTKGKVYTIFGRERNLVRIRDMIQEDFDRGKSRFGKKPTWARLKNTSTNAKIQGSCADLMKFSMCNINDWIEENGLDDDVKIMLTVHDECVFAVRDTPELPEIARKLSEVMTPDLGWKVPIVTDIEIGDNWADVVSIEDYEAQAGLTPRTSHSYNPDQSIQSIRDGLLLYCTWKVTEPRRDLLRLLIKPLLYQEGEGIMVPLYYQQAGSPQREKLGYVDGSRLREAVSDWREVALGLEIKDA